MKLNDEKLAEMEQTIQAAFDQLDQQLDPTFKYQMPPKPSDDQF